jgi:hypothetical protein
MALANFMVCSVWWVGGFHTGISRDRAIPRVAIQVLDLVQVLIQRRMGGQGGVAEYAAGLRRDCCLASSGAAKHQRVRA